MKSLRGLNYEERLKALYLQPLEKRRKIKDLVLTQKTLHNLYRRLRTGLTRSSLRLLHYTGRIRLLTLMHNHATIRWPGLNRNRELSAYTAGAIGLHVGIPSPVFSFAFKKTVRVQ